MPMHGAGRHPLRRISRIRLEQPRRPDRGLETFAEADRIRQQHFRLRGQLPRSGDVCAPFRDPLLLLGLAGPLLREICLLLRFLGGLQGRGALFLRLPGILLRPPLLAHRLLRALARLPGQVRRGHDCQQQQGEGERESRTDR